MDNQDWSHLGDEIKDAVQSAIDTKDFTRLNESIGKTVNRALDHFEQVLDGNNDQKAGSTQRKEQDWGAQTKSAEDSKEPSAQWYNHGTDFTNWGKSWNRQKWGSQSFERGNNQKQKGWNDEIRQNGNSLKTKSKDPFILYRDRYASPVSSTVLGVLFSVFGWMFALGCGIAEFVLLLVGFTIFSGDFPMGVLFSMGILLPFLIAGGWMADKGRKILGMVKRYKKYVGFLRDKEYCELQDLEYASSVPYKKLEKDLNKMIQKGWFLQGHIDRQQTSLIVTEQAYAQYVEAQREFRRRELEEKRKEKERNAFSKDGSDYEKLRADAEFEDGSDSGSGKKAELVHEVPEEVRAVIAEGRGYLKQIKESNDAIPGEEISAKISRLELVTDRIFNRVEQHPDLVEELRRFMKYYLPMTVKLLKAYEELDRQEVQGSNILKSKGEIEDTLDTINRAFENLLDSFFEDTAVDISSDISVMQTLMAQEGLLGGNLKDRIKEKEKILR